jgi:hypothetical protein
LVYEATKSKKLCKRVVVSSTQPHRWVPALVVKSDLQLTVVYDFYSVPVVVGLDVWNLNLEIVE